MNLLLFNLAVDADDPVLGFTTHWINRLAALWDRIDVITMRAGRVAVAPNVRVLSVGKEHGYSEARRALNFTRMLAGLLIRERYAACFAHMMPLFAVMGATLLKVRGVPIMLWYTHRQPSRILRWGMDVSHRVVTAAPDSFPYRTPKLRVLGHGIDTDFFSPDSTVYRPNTVVHVARLMEIKHQATLIRATAASPGIHATFIGDVPPEQDVGYPDALKNLADRLGVTDRVTFAGSMRPEAVREALRTSAIAVNLSPPGLFDKAALESMAMGVPTVVSSEAFVPVLGKFAPKLRIPSPDDYHTLTLRLGNLMRMSADERTALGAALRANVIEQHSLDRLIPRLTNVLRMGEP